MQGRVNNTSAQIQWCIPRPCDSVVGAVSTGGSRSKNDDAQPAEAVGEPNVPWTRRLPYKPTEDERFAHSVSYLPFRVWCSHCVEGLARDWPHRSDYGPPDIPMVAMDFCFANTESDHDVLTILAVKEKPFRPVGATVLPD